MIALGLDAICWRAALVTGNLDLEGVVDEAADLGAAHLQLNLGTLAFATAPEAIAARMRDHGLAVRVTGSPLCLPPAAGTGGEVDRLEQDLNAAAALGSTSLMVYSGRYRHEILASPGGIDAHLDHLGALLRRGAALAHERGMHLELENASDVTAGELVSVIAEVGHPGLGVFLDLTNPCNIHEDAVPAIQRLAPQAVGGHVKDFAVESIPTPDGYHRLGFRQLFRLPGEGISDLPGAIRALRDAVDDHRDFHLAIEGLHTDLERPWMRDRLAASLALLRGLLSA